MAGSPVSNQRGVAILITLVILVLMVVLIVEFDYGTKINLITAGNFRDGVRAAFMAKAGVRAAQSLIKEDLKDPDRFSEFKTSPCMDLGAVPVGEGTASIAICDEASRLNVNRLAKDKNDVWKNIFGRLMTALEIEPGVADALKDWVDEDSDTTGSYGAESDYYSRLDPPYSAKNGPLDSLGELRLIRGVTDEVYQKLITGCDGRPCLTYQTNKVNINTLSVQACRALHEDLVNDESCCVEMTRQRPYKTITELPACWGGLGGGEASSSGIRYELVGRGIPITTDSDFFTVRSTGEVGGSRRTVEALVDRSKSAVLRWSEH